jgi:YidC/Oxa1 family membrane protein insertase
MGQQMYVIHNNPTPGSKAQAAYLDRLYKHVSHHEKTRNRRERAMVKAIVAKGRDRNEYERKFINGLGKAGLAAQTDGTVVKSEAAVATATEDGTPTTAATKRQQPKRQSKSQRQSGGSKAAGNTDPVTSSPSLTKSDQSSDEPESAKPSELSGSANAKKEAAKPGSGSRSKARSGQRKGQQRPKSSSKK